MNTSTRKGLAAAFAGGLVIVAGSASALGSAPPDSGASAADPGENDVFWAPDADLLDAAEDEVNVIAWPGYVEDGSTSPDADWVTPFTDITGCAVNVRLGGTSDEMVQLMQSGEYDGVSASGDATERLIAGGEVGPLDLSVLTSYDQIFDDLKLKPWNSVDGEPYGVPHGRGANLLVYNTETFADGAPDSWSVMFEGGTVADGAVSVYDSAIYIADAAVYLMTHNPELGITDPYSLDQAQFDAAIALLEQQEAIVGQYWSDFSVQIDSLVGGTVVAGTTWQVIVNVALGQGATIEAIKPSEGATGWSDTWMLSTQAANPNCMMLWMDWIASPLANAQATEYFGEAPSNSLACDLTVNPDQCEIFHADDTEFWTDVYYWTTPTTACRDGRTDVECVAYPQWVEAWAALRA